MATDTNTTKSKMKKRKIVHGEGRLMIANVYHFLKEEFAFTELYKERNCDVSHLRNITMRTAEATGVSERTVQKILKEERDMKKKEQAGTDKKSTNNESKKENDEYKNKDTEDKGTASKLTESSTQEEPSTVTSNMESTSKGIPEGKRKKRKVVHNEGREMIASIYFFLKGEYEVTDLYREPNTDFTHLRNITRRTAEAAGVSERTVQKVLKEERDMIKSGEANGSSKPVKRNTKKDPQKTKKKPKDNTKGKNKKTGKAEAGAASKIIKKKGRTVKNKQNSNDASTSSNLPPIETNNKPLPTPPPPPTCHQSHLLPPPLQQ